MPHHEHGCGWLPAVSRAIHVPPAHERLQAMAEPPLRKACSAVVVWLFHVAVTSYW